MQHGMQQKEGLPARLYKTASTVHVTCGLVGEREGESEGGGREERGREGERGRKRGEKTTENEARTITFIP
ncbi:hypothetical protein AOLI_G00161330 [Acnodon oligacanthus]